MLFEIILYAYAFFLNVCEYWMQDKHFIYSHSQIRVHNYFIWWSKEIWWKCSIKISIICKRKIKCEKAINDGSTNPIFIVFVSWTFCYYYLCALHPTPSIQIIFILQKLFDFFSMVHFFYVNAYWRHPRWTVIFIITTHLVHTLYGFIGAFISPAKVFREKLHL